MYQTYCQVLLPLTIHGSGYSPVLRFFLATTFFVIMTIHVYMFDYLRNIADALLGRDCDLKKASILGVGSDKKIPSFTTPYCQEIDPLLRYQMFLSIMHLLANMQSNYPLSREVLSDNRLGFAAVNQFTVYPAQKRIL